MIGSVAARIEIETVRRKSSPRALVSRALASCGFAFYDMCFGEAGLEHTLEPGCLTRSLTFPVARSQDLERIRNLRGPRMADRILCNERLASRCHVAMSEGEVAGYAWSNTRVFEFLGQSLWDLPPGTMCIHDVFVFPQHRGNRVFQNLLADIFRSGRIQRRHKAFCVVDRSNAPAIAAFQHLGMHFRRAPILKLPGLNPIQLGAKPGRGVQE